MSSKPIHIGFVFFPGMTQLDVTGPFEVLARLPNARVHLLWKRIEPVISDVGLPLMPTVTFENCPDLDIFCIGGGPGMTSIMDDDEVISFVRERCELGPTLFETTDELFRAWCAWCESSGHVSGAKETFAKNLRAAVSSLDRKQRGGRGKKRWVLVGIRKKAAARGAEA